MRSLKQIPRREGGRRGGDGVIVRCVWRRSLGRREILGVAGGDGFSTMNELVADELTMHLKCLVYVNVMHL